MKNKKLMTEALIRTKRIYARIKKYAMIKLHFK